MDVNLNSMGAYIGSTTLPPTVTNQADSGQGGNSQAGNKASVATISPQAVVDPRQANAGNKGDEHTGEKAMSDGKAFFDVDDDKNVVIKVTDSSGKVVQQIPAEQYLQTMKVLDANAKNLLQSSNGNNLYHKEA
ncbi:flagellar protein FlaG [Candidatus Magnetominusculus dajiuhuensis]|uniref:flagellar protein FlaG n=1 Tax=Candidatus Magnetominusculus dajiuhuensis TaxID=3137712 RepID=UPI003B43B695